MTIKETPNKITAVLKVAATAEFFDDEASEETVRYSIEQDLEDAGFDVDVSLLKEQEAVRPILTPWIVNDDGEVNVYKMECGKCGIQFYYEDQKYCSECGTPILWEGR